MTAADRETAAELHARFVSLSEDFVAHVNQIIDSGIDDERPIDDETLARWQARGAELEAAFRQLDEDVDAATLSRRRPPASV